MPPAVDHEETDDPRGRTLLALVDKDSCPHCTYALVGLPARATVCPECGGSLSAMAFAAAAAGRMARNSRARMALIASPGIGIILSAPVIFAFHRGAYAGLLVLLVCLWLGAATAIYHTTGRPGSRRARRAILLGLPLGVAYFAVLVLIALAVVYIIALSTH